MKKLSKLFTVLIVATMLSLNPLYTDAAPKTATPPAPTLGYTPSAPTNGNVTVTIYYPTSAVLKQYKLGTNGVWVTYASPFAVTSNAYICAQYKDKNGNWSAQGGVTITNIDKIPPTNPAFTVSNTSITNQNVTVTVLFSADSAIKQYKIGSGTWTSYVSPILITSNSTVYAKASDSAGNWSNTSICEVANIDKTPPSAPVLTADSSGPTNSNVLVSVAYSSDASVKQYKIGIDGAWNNYVSPVELSENSEVYARAQDLAGNWSAESSLIVSNIDKLAPQAPAITASLTQLTNRDISVSIEYSSDSVLRQYKTQNAPVWSDYTDPINISSNDVVFARASDLAGNWSNETALIISNIDKTAPAIPVISASSIVNTVQPVVITINYSNDSAVQQYRIGLNGTWTNYTMPFSLSSNNVIYARASDEAGNWSPEPSYSVSNIVPAKMILGYTVKYSSSDVSSYNSIVTNTGSLNEIATATFNVDGYGNLTGTAPADQIGYSNNNGIRPNLMVSNSFDSNIAKQLLENTTYRQNLINNILNTLRNNNYKGVDIDLENIPAADRDCLTAFMSQLYSTLKPLGYGVSVAVQAKTYDSPNAAWNYAFDYKSLAQYSDYLMIMAYDEHYPGGTPGAVASIGFVTNVVDYALTVVPKEKIVLGLAAYGYDWSTGATKSYSINGCLNLANLYGSTIYFDSTTKSKYFTYSANGITHTVWFEDGDTISYKLDLVNSRNLKGIGIWRLGLENANFWTVIKSKLNQY